MARIITAHSEGNLDFDRLISSICARYPGAAVSDPDYYATRLAREIVISRRFALGIPNPVLECTKRVAEKHGIQREILIPIREGVKLTGRLDQLGCLFTTQKDSECPRSEEVKPLLDILTQLGLRVETLT